MGLLNWFPFSISFINTREVCWFAVLISYSFFLLQVIFSYQSLFFCRILGRLFFIAVCHFLISPFLFPPFVSLLQIRLQVLHWISIERTCIPVWYLIFVGILWSCLCVAWCWLQVLIHRIYHMEDTEPFIAKMHQWTRQHLLSSADLCWILYALNYFTVCCLYDSWPIGNKTILLIVCMCCVFVGGCVTHVQVCV